MRRFTLLLTGVPQYVMLQDLSYNLDRLFNTDEIETFKVRDLPNHPQTNKRQIALDFRTSYDAMAAQEKLEGYTYELDNGREYTLHAKMNKSEEYKCNESLEYGGSRCYGDGWTSLAMIPNVSDSDIYRANATLDAQLELLKKQKLVLEKEKELLNEKQKLKRKYGSMHTYDAEAEVSSSKRSRSTSRNRSSSSKHPRSRSRETRTRRSRSKDRGYVLPQIEWYDERSKTKELRSHSKERSRSRAYNDERRKTRENRSHSRERSRSRVYNDKRTKTRELSSHSRERSRSRAYNDKCTKTRDLSSHSRERSRSRAYNDKRKKTRELSSHSRERSRSRAYNDKRTKTRKFTSHSRERSRSRAYSRNRRSRSHSRDRRSRSHSRVRRSRSHSRDRRSRSHSRDRRSRSHSRDRRSRSHFTDRRSGSHSSDRRSRSHSRDRRSRSLELREHRYPVSRKRNPRSRSNETYRRSPSVERIVRARSRSQDRLVRSRESRPREGSSHSRELMYSRRSRDSDRIPYRRSRSRDRARLSNDRVSSDWDQRGRRLRSPDGRTSQLAIMSSSLRRSSSAWSIESLKAVTPPLPLDTKHKTDIKNKKIHINAEKDAKNTRKSADAKENKTDNKMKDTERRKVDKNNSKLRKAEKTASRVESLSKDVMILVAILVDEIMDRDRIRISAANKITLIKILEALVQERLEPLARVKKTDDKEVLKRYKKQFPMHGDLTIIKQMLNEITKLEMKKAEATITSSSEINPSHPSEKTKTKHYFVIRPRDPVTGSGRLNKTDNESKESKEVEDIEVLDENRDRQEPAEQQCTNPTVDLTQAESTGNAPKIKTETKNEPIVVIDIDSADKPVPRHPQFVLVIKHLVKNMNKVIRTKKLGGKITFAELKYVLRQILRKMLKGQGFLSREDIIRRFREIHPMEDDEQFLRNTIKDIGDGKYPVLIGKVVDVPENESPDDVILIEKKCDVVTLTDSDDDDEKEKPNIDVISLNSDPKYDNLVETKSNSSTSQSMPGSSNCHVKLVALNPGYEGSTNSGKVQPRSTAEANTDLVRPDIEAKKVSDSLGQTSMTGPIVESADPDQANSCCKIVVASGRDMPDLGSPGQIKTSLAIPIQGQPALVNPAQTNAGLVKPSQAKKVADPIQGMPEPANCSEVNTGLGNHATTSVPNPIQAQTGPVNDSQAIARPAISCQAKEGPNNPGQSNTGALLSAFQTRNGRDNSGQANISHGNLGQSETCLNVSQAIARPPISCQAMKGPNNPGQSNTGALSSAFQTKNGRDNSGQANISPGNFGQSETCLNVSQAIARLPISCQAMKGPNNPGQSNTGAFQTKNGRDNSGQANISHGNLGQSETCLNASQATRRPEPDQAKKGPVNISTMSMEEKEKRASLDNTIQDLESKKQQTPDNKDSKNKERTNNEESDNNLKVTAITIITSLNELIAKTTEIISPDEIKEEIEVSEEAELDDSSLKLDSAPRVTSITIMTSEAELLSIGNEDPKEVEIKNETDVDYDAEDNFVKDIERALDDVNFGSIQNESVEQNSVNSEQCSVNNTGQSGVNNSGQLGSVNNSGQFNKTSLPQDSRTVPDDEETIESIVKYVASLY